MATLLRPPLVSSRQRKTNIGFAFVAANLLTTTLANAGVSNLTPASVQDTGGSQPKRPIGTDQYPNLLTSTLAQPTLGLPLNAERWDDSAPRIRKDVSCDQRPSVLVRGINPNAKVQGLTESAPYRRQIGDIDPQPTLLTTTLAVAAPVLALPLNSERWDDSIPIRRYQVFDWQQQNLLNQLLSPPGAIPLPLSSQQWDDSAPPLRRDVSCWQAPSLLVRGINPNAKVGSLTDSAPPRKRDFRRDDYPNLSVTTLAPVGPKPFFNPDFSRDHYKFEVVAEQLGRPLTLGIDVITVHIPNTRRAIVIHDRDRGLILGSRDRSAFPAGDRKKIT